MYNYELLWVFINVTVVVGKCTKNEKDEIIWADHKKISDGVQMPKKLMQIIKDE